MYVDRAAAIPTGIDGRELCDSGGVGQRTLSPEEGGARVLDDSDLAALAKLGMQLEAHFGQPLDVEWAFETGILYLLQARPVTA